MSVRSGGAGRRQRFFFREQSRLSVSRCGNVILAFLRGRITGADWESKVSELDDSGGTKAFPGGEDPMEFRKRCVCGFEQMMEKMIKGKRKKIAFVVHGGTIMSVMEAFDPEKKEFYHWQVKNGKGFHFQIEEEKWQQGKRQFEEIEEI